VPHYGWKDPCPELFQAVRNAPRGPVLVAVESVDTLCQDLGSISQTYKFLHSLLALVVERPAPSRLLITLDSSSPILPRLIPPSFSSTLTLVGLHSPILIRHLAESYLIFPPPHSPPDKYWTMLNPAIARGESEQLAFSTVMWDPAKGFTCDGRDPFSGIADVTIRSPGAVVSGTGSSRSRVHNKSIGRHLEGWMLDPESGDVKNVAWDQIPTLQDLLQVRLKATTDPIGSDHKGLESLSFNVNLTDAQVTARAKVPLPYAHEDAPVAGTTVEGQCQIIYDPDSADDLDDDDPDEDLDI